MENHRKIRIDQLKTLLKATPDDEFLRYALALEHFNSGNIDDAESNFLKLIKDNPDYTATYYHLAKLYEHKNEVEKAKEIYNKGIEATIKTKDNHALSELRNALNELEFDDY